MYIVNLVRWMNEEAGYEEWVAGRKTCTGKDSSGRRKGRSSFMRISIWDIAVSNRKSAKTREGTTYLFLQFTHLKSMTERERDGARVSTS